MRIALVHDFLNEYGGAERVLEALSDLFPDAPIYTAFYKEGSQAWIRFKNKTIKTSWVHNIPFFATKLYSPLRFLAPLIWGSFDFSSYDVVIGSSGWYVTKGFNKPPAKGGGKTIEICYCHTPPRWLYGYKTAVEWQRYWPVRVYAAIVGHFMRMYDYKSAQKVDHFIANSQEVAMRIKKFYRRESTVIYPPVTLPVSADKKKKRGDYYFIVSRLVGAKGIDLAIEAANKLGIKLKIAGVPSGYKTSYEQLSQKAANNIEFLGFVSDTELVDLYSQAKAFLALAIDEDFGITPVESMLCGTPVIAYRGGGYLETVVDGKTGVFFDELTVESLTEAIKSFDKLRINTIDCIRQAQKFSKDRFLKEIKEFVNRRGIKNV